MVHCFLGVRSEPIIGYLIKEFSKRIPGIGAFVSAQCEIIADAMRIGMIKTRKIRKQLLAFLGVAGRRMQLQIEQ